MSTVPAALQAGIEHHRAGRFSEAAAIYQQILAADPRHAEAMQLLGVLAYQAGRHDTAIRLISEAIQIDGTRAAYFNNLGEAFRATGKFEDAQRCFAQAIQQEPNDAAAYSNLARISAAQGRYADAADLCRKAVALDARNPQYHNLLGSLLEMLGQSDEARACFEGAVAGDPRFYDALANLAGAHARAKQYDQAEAYLRRALEVYPDSADAHLRLGDLHSVQGKWAKAVAHYQSALRIDPKNAVAECHWAMALQAQEQFDEALEHYRRALALVPNDVETRLHLATTLSLKRDDEGAADEYRRVLEIDPANNRALPMLRAYLIENKRLVEALAIYDRAIEASPDDAELRRDRGMVALLNGDFQPGWQGYRCRAKARDVEGTEWDGTPGSDTTLVIHAEQGRGDTMQFVRYLPLVKQRVARAILTVPKSVVQLLEQSGYEDVLAFDDPLPHYDYKISILDLPGVFGTNIDTIPAEIPYLAADENLVSAWADRLGPRRVFRVGICWQGNPKHSDDYLRSIPLVAFAPLAGVAGVELVSLQTTAGLEQLEALGGQFNARDLRPDYEIEDGAFLNAAAVIRNLDLVVSADTAIAHLAGAMGVPIWVALSTRQDWRWMLDRDDTPWYPTMRLFRQTKPRDWTEPLERMVTELKALVEDRPG